MMSILSLVSKHSFGSGEQGSEKSFVVTDVNNDGTIGGGDFGVKKKGEVVSLDPKDIPFTAASGAILANKVYEGAQNKAVVLLGEDHKDGADNVLAELCKVYATNGANPTACLELDEYYMSGIFSEINKIEKSNLKKDDVRNKLYDCLLVNMYSMLLYRNGNSDLKPILLSELGTPDMDKKVQFAKEQLKSSVEGRVTLNYISNILLCRYYGAQLHAVDVHENKDVNVYSLDRETRIANSIEKSPGKGVKIALIGQNHASRELPAWAAGAKDRGRSAGGLLDDHYGKSAVYHVNIMPGLVEAFNQKKNALDYVAADPNGPDGSALGSYKVSSFDIFLYHDMK